MNEQTLKILKPKPQEEIIEKIKNLSNEEILDLAIKHTSVYLINYLTQKGYDITSEKMMIPVSWTYVRTSSNAAEFSRMLIRVASEITVKEWISWNNPELYFKLFENF